MTDPMTPSERAAIRRTARLQAIRMGLRAPEPDPSAPDPAALPTTNLFALRGLLATGRLTAAQSVAARQVLAEAETEARQITDAPQTPAPATGDAT